ncbi:ketoacyl-ACP synthase III [Streptomyces sp. ISL-22]|uniref:Beta-ketoacyl-[acyl-carrier-protein] synthase III n=1 Tax=Streptomyces curacoi TaxID=146536 RepID=A0A124GW28_9ACTN|nr:MULTISPECIES: beta-ketoacyl-ACP synthase III [Streptomyces]KUM69467.1 3-oxoacyl-ACP synthase [Streptomyces curacoi]MBT2423727.1 ketoacyl-ACP synthase III [Streptomyces sp. ISL-24]MBT2433851.1 ketoacyl-ACP synthase III [Streptomyces sp. ISL-22]
MTDPQRTEADARPAAVLKGLGTYLPPRAVSNDELSERLDTSDEWIRTRTGIRQRFWADPGTATGDLAVEAGARALKSAGVDGVDAVVLATTTPDHPCPGTAPWVAARLGLGPVPAYDVAAVCAGFVYALASAAGLILTGVAERVLVIGAETYSGILDPADRNTAVIFGDGAGAVVLEAGRADEPGALLGFDLGSDGEQHDLIAIPGGGSRQRAASPYFTMQGKKVFAQAVTRMGQSSTALLERLGWPKSSVDRLVGHQANVRILHAVADLLDIDRERAVVNLDRVGNTSAASIPLALADAAGSGELRPGERVVLTAFGGGLAWGSTALVWPDVTPN